LRVEETALADPVLYAESIAGPLPERIAKLEGNTESHIRQARDLTSRPCEPLKPD
jgi:hypothetical protein